MKKTFLLGTSPWIFLFMAFLFLTNGTLGLFEEEQSRLKFWLMVANFGIGLYAILFVLFVLTDIMGTAPKVVVHNEGVLLKAKAFSSGREIKWEEVQGITFHSYQIDFKLDTKPLFFDYKAKAKTSKQIKDAIRDMANLKGITVTGG